MRDPNRAPQTAASTNLKSFLKQFQASESGHGPKRVQCLTLDTRRALVQTTEGLSFKPQKGLFPWVGIYSPVALSMFYLENSRAAASRIPAIYVGQCIHDGWGCQHSLQKAHHKICCFLPGAH